MERIRVLERSEAAMNLPLADPLLRACVAHRSRSAPVALLENWRAAEARRVLLLLTTGLGDAVLSTPVLPALRRALPQADIRLFCRAAWAPLFEHDPDLNGVLRYHGRYRRFFATLRELRAFAPDTALVLHGNDPDILPLAYLAGSRTIVRIPTSGTRYPFLLSNAARAADRATLPNTHYVENRLRILDSLGLASSSHQPRVHVPEAARATAAARLAQRTGGRPYWVLHWPAADPYKVWPRDKAAALLAGITARFPNHAVLLTGTRGDHEPLRALRAAASNSAINVAGEFDIAGTAACLAGARCVVAPDTGVLHLAAAVGAPVIGLYAPTRAALVGPRSAGAAPVVIEKPLTCDPCLEKRCPYTPNNCMSQIDIEEVEAALARRLEFSA
jgi:ADP-heptose:LPS heptosyltransferase